MDLNSGLDDSGMLKQISFMSNEDIRLRASSRSRGLRWPVLISSFSCSQGSKRLNYLPLDDSTSLSLEERHSQLSLNSRSPGAFSFQACASRFTGQSTAQ